MTRVWLFVLAASMLAGCLGDAGFVCADGTLCPDGTTCATVGGRTRCVTDDQRAQCATGFDGATCSIGGQPVGVCNDQVCVRAGCGDGLVTGAEQCDGDALGGDDVNEDGLRDCRDLGFYTAGTLSCLDDCRYDRNGCGTAGRCGDGIVNGDEDCDGEALADQDCASAGGFYEPAGLACSAACRFDFSACTGRCGDDVINGDEECDGAALPLGAACEAYPVSAGSSTMFHPGGTVGCNVGCTLSFASCSGGFCGDNVMQAGEACDRFDVGDATCAPYSGSVSCSSDCSAVIATCAGSCGDAIVNGPERCDPAGSPHTMPAGISCTTFGYYTGAPTCSADCDAIDIAACGGRCGDGIVQANEACDGADHAGADCSSFGGRGALGCDEFCQRDFSSCQTGSWQRRTHPSFTGTLSAVWSQNGVAAFTIGQAGVFEWNGREWIEHTARPGAGLPGLGTFWTAVWGDARNVWVAALDQVYRYEPLVDAGDGLGTWVLDIGGGSAVFGLWGDGQALYAATNNGVQRRTALGWSLEPGTAGYGFEAIHGRGDTIVAVGAAGVVRKIGDGAWTPLAVSGTWVRVSVWSSSTIWLASTSTVAVYIDGPSPELRPAALPQFSPTLQPLVRGVFAAAADDVYIAVQGAPNALLRWTGAYQSDRPAFTQLSIGTLPALGAIGGSGAGDVWLVGAGATFHHDGSGWQSPVLAFDSPTPPVVPVIDHVGVAVTPRKVWLGGRTPAFDSALIAFDAETTVPGPYTMPAIAPNLSALWAGANGVLWHASGETVQALVEAPLIAPPPFTFSAPVVAMWGTGDHVFAASSHKVALFDGATWSEEALPPPQQPLQLLSLHAIGGTSAHDLWAAGGEVSGQLYHRTQSGWTEVAAPPGVARFTAVWAAAPNDVWLAGNMWNGDLSEARLFHWDGAQWHLGGRFPLVDLFAIWGSGSFDVWAVGTLGTVLHYDGHRWTQIAIPTFEHLRAVHGSGPDDVWAVGDNGARFKLTQRLPQTSPGMCAGAVPLYCGELAPRVGTTFGAGAAYYRFDAPSLPDTTELALSVASPSGEGVELAVYRAASAADSRCDLVAPALAPVPAQAPTAFSFTAAPGATYYVAVRRASGSAIAANSFTLNATCTYAPDPND